VSAVRYEVSCYIPEDDILHSHHRKNLTSYKGPESSEQGKNITKQDLHKFVYDNDW
jgi:hypothetical protein